MTPTRHPGPARRLAAGALLALLTGCGGGEKTAPTVVQALLCQADTPVAANQVGFECPASSLGNLLITVVIGGPSTATDIYGVQFDLVFDSTVLAFQIESGLQPFLEKEGGTAQVLTSIDGSDPDRLVAAISLLGNVGGVQVTGSKEKVAGLLFRGLNPGTTTVRFENGRLVDSALNPIASIAFTGTLVVDVQ